MYLLNVIVIVEVKLFWICIDFFGFIKIFFLFIWELKYMFFFFIFFIVESENIWNLFELVSIGLF